VTEISPEKFRAKVLVLGVTDGSSGDVVLLRPDTDVEPGTRVM
jgi:hypothetical protein